MKKRKVFPIVIFAIITILCVLLIIGTFSRYFRLWQQMKFQERYFDFAEKCGDEVKKEIYVEFFSYYESSKAVKIPFYLYIVGFNIFYILLFLFISIIPYLSYFYLKNKKFLEINDEESQRKEQKKAERKALKIAKIEEKLNNLKGNE